MREKNNRPFDKGIAWPEEESASSIGWWSAGGLSDVQQCVEKFS